MALALIVVIAIPTLFVIGVWIFVKSLIICILLTAFVLIITVLVMWLIAFLSMISWLGKIFWK